VGVWSRGVIKRFLTVMAGLLLALAAASPAHAAFPGANGKIAFESNRDGNVEVYTMNPDGSAQARITNSAPYADRMPAWSPDGKQLVIACFDATEFCLRNADGSGAGTFFGHWGDITHPSWSPDGARIVFDITQLFCDPPEDLSECWLSQEIATVGIDGSGYDPVTSNDGGPDVEPTWSPDGQSIIFAQHNEDGLGKVEPDGDARTTLFICCADPNWSPDGTKLAYTVHTGSDWEILVSNPDGSDQDLLTNNTVDDLNPVWSPDGSKIAFASNEGGDFEVFVVNADGSGRQALTNNTVADEQPDWQPIPLGYPRPKIAAALSVSLVPAYAPCTAANREHGPPLAFASCHPPAQASPALTIGTPDANSNPAESVGLVKARAVGGVPGTPADEADVAVEVSLSDVRALTTLDDYAGELELELGVRTTDRFNGGAGPGTVIDTVLPVAVPCGATSSTTVGATCAVVTTIDALIPGAIPEGRRSVWEIGQVRVNDGGSDGLAATQPNDPFAVQGVFVP